jgi:hypothetical protein
MIPEPAVRLTFDQLAELAVRGEAFGAATRRADAEHTGA